MRGVAGADSLELLERQALGELRMKFKLQFKRRLLNKFPENMKKKPQH